MLDELKKLHAELLTLKREVKSEKGDRINKNGIRNKAEELGVRWFSDYSEELTNAEICSPDTIAQYSQSFGRLIKISAPSNLKKSYIDILKRLTKSYRNDFLIPIQTTPNDRSKTSLLSKFLENITDSEESEYLQEAISCAKQNCYRASAVLGWCAAVDRIHKVIEKHGFTEFNVTSDRMANQTKGRYKRFNATQSIGSITELREVFDTTALWVLEGMQFIDTNQHTRLRSCFDLRCQCAHPGDAPVTEYNLLSFYSDIDKIIFKNETFSL